VKRIRGDEPNGTVIHIYMETSQRNPLCSYLYLKLAKISCFSFYLFSSAKSEQEGGKGPVQGGGLAPVGGRGGGERR
jgi:hypothetical protein